MRVTYSIQDGYVCGKRERTITIPDEAFEDDMDEQDKQTVIDEFVQGDFAQCVSWSIVKIE